MIDTVIDVEFDVWFVLKIDVAIHLGKDAVFDLEFDVKIDPVVDDAIDFAIDREFELMIDRAEVGGGAIFCVIFALRMLKVINACANEPEANYDNFYSLLL